ncbi:MAG: 2OG-Fe(II) oxygenase [Saprospiraceae bacterium]
MIHNFDLLQTRSNIPITQVQIVPNFLHPHEISFVLEMANSLRVEQGKILGRNTNPALVLRQSDIKWLEWNESNWWLFTKFVDKIEQLNKAIWTFDLFGVNEYFQYTEYHGMASNRGHYDWHIDISHDGLTSNRKISFECILDDDHDGGEFSMLLGPTENKFKLNKGDVVFYPSYLLNKVYPVTRGTRRSLVGWISGPSFK